MSTFNKLKNIFCVRGTLNAHDYESATYVWSSVPLRNTQDAPTRNSHAQDDLQCCQILRRLVMVFSGVRHSNAHDSD
jgi:hypothetical protein